MNFELDVAKPIPSICRTVLRGLEIDPCMRFAGTFRTVQHLLERQGYIARESRSCILTELGKRLLENR